MHPRYVIALLIGLGLALSGAASASPPPLPALAVVFYVAPPSSDAPDLAAADVALRAPEELGMALRAMRAHPGARLAFAIDPAYVSALKRAASGDTPLRAVSAIKQDANGTASSEILAILARHRPIDGALTRTRAGSRYLTLATAAHNKLIGDASMTFSEQDLADFAGTDAQVSLAASGFASPAATGLDDVGAIEALMRADRAIVDELDAAQRAGTVELIATPDHEPVLPLLVDAGGKTTADPHVVVVGARADALWLTDDAVRRVGGAAHAQKLSGFYSPFGAYDDATAALIQSAGASYALFSDRVVHGAGGEGTMQGLEGARSAALHPYALTVAKGVTLTTVFWAESASDDLESTFGSDAALGERLITLESDAASGQQDAYPHLQVLRLHADGSWAQRPDATAVMEKFVATIASGRAGRATTPGSFVRSHVPTATAYGYPPNAESGSFALWMGTANQASLWKALADARKAAGGDAAIKQPHLRERLFASESGNWYSMLAAPWATGRSAAKLDAFRETIAAVYREAGVPPPAAIAPVQIATPAPSPTAAPSAASSPAPPGP
jgi:alpha-amylase/alpha-mannosidase (GH57 family)